MLGIATYSSAAAAVTYDPAASGATTQLLTALIVDAPRGVARTKPSTSIACKALTVGLTQRVISVGEPAFRIARCRFASSAELGKAMEAAGWYAVLRAGEAPVRLDLVWQPAPGVEPVVTSSVELPRPTPSELLGNHTVLSSAATTLLAASPVAATVDVTKLGSTTQKPLVIAARRGRNLDPSSKIRLYSLAWSAHGKRWEPRVFADLTLRQQEYHGTWQRHPGKTARVAFVHDAAGPEAAAAVWRQRLDAAVIASDTRRLELLSARSSLPQGMAAVDSVGHFGMRIGQQMASGSELLSGAQYVSLYAEATGRYIGGLRASLELVPTVSAEIDGATQEFGWRRAGIGYAFGFNIPWLIDRIEVVPRATVWTFKAVVPYANFDEGAPEEFKVDNQLSHGVNVAVISLLGDFLVKPWYGRDIELPLDELKVGSVVQTTMVGLDLYFSQPSWRLWNRPVGLLAFALGEQITILKGGKDADDVRRSIEIRDMFAGLGTLMAF